MMFAKRVIFHGSALVEANIVSSETPAEFPLTTENIDNAGSGYNLAPGSTIYVTGTGKKYRLGDDNIWKETST